MENEQLTSNELIQDSRMFVHVLNEANDNTTSKWQHWFEVVCLQKKLSTFGQHENKTVVSNFSFSLLKKNVHAQFWLEDNALSTCEDYLLFFCAKYGYSFYLNINFTSHS